MQIIYLYLFNLSLYLSFIFICFVSIFLLIILFAYLFLYEGSHRGRTHRSPSHCGFPVRSYLCPYKWRIYKGAFYNALRESRRCKESCRMRWGGERGLIILSRTISCQPRAATLAIVVVLRTLVPTPSQRTSATRLHSRTRVHARATV